MEHKRAYLFQTLISHPAQEHLSSKGHSHETGGSVFFLSTFLPIIGIFVAFPVLALAFYFFRPGKWVIAEREEALIEVPETGAEESMAA